MMLMMVRVAPVEYGVKGIELGSGYSISYLDLPDFWTERETVRPVQVQTSPFISQICLILENVPCEGGLKGFPGSSPRIRAALAG